ncbi:D-alanyl-D-alanine carboxypeptidase family protein [Mediterraneibacter butyricigenes]|nr:D-alanyl-D-alanine carboxypeptidase [Dorea sp. OM02-2LB]RGV97787.1 D-alanyl-D-alanine carboxypeptidase [Ruminococcus sp. AF14-10]
MISITGCTQTMESCYVSDYEESTYNHSLYQEELFAKDLCVTAGNISLENYPVDTSLHAAGLFNLSDHQVLYAQNLFTKLFPASTTKILTAYVALKYGNLDDMVTVSENAIALPADASVCKLQAGDQISLRDLLYGLLLQSGNDAAIAIAEHISGSVESFASLMNQEAKDLGATRSNFVNPHGLEDPNHYTTAYDLYLIFQADIASQTFRDIISQAAYTCNVTGSSGVRTLTWTSTNYYAQGKAAAPAGVHVIGGKTGTTDEAGSCVILYEEADNGKSYISIVMGAQNKDVLYADTTNLLQYGIIGN